ncbi:unnamed protein product [Caenorhabditis auriculariae]|uniref:UDP-glucuronosyltransferase n=1 Tax=Caenorhabditis auriculariae TaxID=2777116 RepID=A0A8S1HF00_9PELO|nr:unnamed protein product [Caenorhabditis auriculariae]
MKPREGLTLALLQLFAVSEAGKILVYSPSISTSHLISNGRIADALVDAGHDVVMFIPEYMPLTSFLGTKKAKVITMRNINPIFGEMMDGWPELTLKSDRLSVMERLDFEYTATSICGDLMKRRDELKPLADYGFDVGFSEQIDLCGVGVIRYLGIKNHLWISTTSIMDAVSYNLGIPAPPSYVPTIEENDNGDVMDFWQRSFNLYMYVAAIVVHRIGTDGTTAVFRQFDPVFPNVREIAANSSLCFVNSDEIFDLPRPIIHKTIYIGGLGVDKEPKPLDEKFSKLMEKGRKGVIIISLGSIIPFAIKEFEDYHFIIKIDKGDNKTGPMFAGVPNYDLVEWLPQVDILGHPRLKLFVMHGGLNGLVEAALRGVPLVVVPVFADQFRNGRAVEKRGIGKVIHKLDMGYDTFKSTVKEIVENPKYSENAKRLGAMMRDKPFSPKDRLVKWTEFAIENGVLEELHVEGSRMNTIVYLNLDKLFVHELGLPGHYGTVNGQFSNNSPTHQNDSNVDG